MIDAAIFAGTGADTILKRFPDGISLDSIHRHRAAGHHERALKALAIATPDEKRAMLGEKIALSASTIIDKSGALLERAEAYLNKAEASGDLNAMGKAIAAVERSLRLAAELRGLFPRAGTQIDARSVTINAFSDMSADELRAIAAGASPDE